MNNNTAFRLDERIGTVVSSASTPTFSTLHVHLDAGKRVRPGELLLAAADEGMFSVGRVVEGREVNIYEGAQKAHLRKLLDLKSVSSDHEDLPGKYRIIELDLLEEVVYTEGHSKLREPQTLVPAGSPVYRSTGTIVNLVLGLSSNDEENGKLMVGHTVGKSASPVPLDGRIVLPRHILIVGTTGTGKSWLHGVLTEEIQEIGLPQINIDVHGELVKAAEELGGINLVPGRNITVPITSLSEPEILELIPFLTDLQGEIVRRAFLELKKRTTIKGINGTLDDLLEEINEVGKRMQARSQTIGMARARTDMLQFVPIIGEGIDWEAVLKRGICVNIDCRMLPHSELHAVVGAIGRQLLGLRMKGRIPPFAFSVDEAHLFIPHQEKTTSGQVLRELIRYGRHYGICLILITQSPTDVDRRIIRITNTRFLFAIEPDQLDALRGVFADAPRDLIKRLPKIEVGTCLLTGSRETVRHAIPIKIRGRRTTHGGETPDLIEQVKEMEAKRRERTKGEDR